MRAPCISGDAPAVEAAQSAAAAAMASEGPWSLSRRALWQLQLACAVVRCRVPSPPKGTRQVSMMWVRLKCCCVWEGQQLELEDYMYMHVPLICDRPRDSRYCVCLELGYTCCRYYTPILGISRMLRQLLLVQKHLSWSRLLLVPSDNLWILEHGVCTSTSRL